VIWMEVRLRPPGESFIEETILPVGSRLDEGDIGRRSPFGGATSSTFEATCAAVSHDSRESPLTKLEANADRRDGFVRSAPAVRILMNFSSAPPTRPIIEQGVPNLQGHLPREDIQPPPGDARLLPRSDREGWMESTPWATVREAAANPNPGRASCAKGN
jgi:hypothetical protein